MAMGSIGKQLESAMNAKVPKYALSRLSNEEDEEAFLRFWNENHERPLGDKYRAWYQGNPAGKATVLLVRETESDSVVACAVIFPRRLCIDGVYLRAALGGDFLVHKNHRVLLPALKLMRGFVSVVDDGEFDLIYGFPNAGAEPVMKTAGLMRLGPRARMSKVARVSAHLRKLRPYMFLDKLLSPLVDVLTRLFVFETWYRFKGGFLCEEISGFDERFDDLWAKIGQGSRVIGERTAESLAWRYPNAGGAGYRIFAMSSSDRANVEGYIVYCLDEHSISIKDFVLPDGGRAIRILFAHFLRHVKKGPIRSVSVVLLGNRDLFDVLKRLGFAVRKREGDWPVYYYCSEQVLKRIPALADPQSWQLSEFDTESVGT